MISVFERISKKLAVQDIPDQPWVRIKWDPETEQRIFKEWGDYYTHRLRLNLARHYYDLSISLDSRDFRAYFKRSRCKRLTAMSHSALRDSKRAARLAAEMDNGIQNAQMKLEVCDAMYEANLYEEALMELHNNSTYFRIRNNQSYKRFDNRIMVIEENFHHSVGPSYGPFIISNEDIIDAALKKYRTEHHVDSRPLWKIMREQARCDVLSILEKERPILSPMEMARRERAFSVFAQTHLKESWTDAVFLRNVVKNPNCMLQQSKRTTPYLISMIGEENKILKRFMKMLQVRLPMYAMRFNKCLNKQMCDDFHEGFLYSVQYQTRRNMLISLRTIRKLRDKRKLRRLSDYIEAVMGNFTVIKTNRVMPWKFVFMNEVYNILALTYLEQYNAPPNIKIEESAALQQLLRLPTRKEFKEFLINDRSTYNDPDAIDPSIDHARKMVGRYEKRLMFTKHNIEKAYLRHQIAQYLLIQNRQDECISNARKAVEEARLCNNIVWEYLGNLLMCKSNVFTHKSQTAKELFEVTLEVAYRMKVPRIILFTELCYAIICEDLRRKMSMSHTSSLAPSAASSMNIKYSRS